MSWKLRCFSALSQEYANLIIISIIFMNCFFPTMYQNTALMGISCLMQYGISFFPILIWYIVRKIYHDWNKLFKMHYLSYISRWKVSEYAGCQIVFKLNESSVKSSVESWLLPSPFSTLVLFCYLSTLEKIFLLYIYWVHR